MEQFINAETISKILIIMQGLCMAIGAITLLATVIVRLTPTKVDDQAMGKVSKVVLKVLHWLPTIGVNPQTKKLEEAIMQYREATNPGV
jgi:Na+-transporting NADH:ubiquinone oxidoreductase subunit NqrC